MLLLIDDSFTKLTHGMTSILHHSTFMVKNSIKARLIGEAAPPQGLFIKILQVYKCMFDLYVKYMIV